MAENVRVLIVEDDIYWSDYLQAALEKLGYTIAGVAATVEQALALLGSIELDIAMVDITLNGKKSGIDIGRLITKTYKVPFVFITSEVSDEVVKEVVDAGPSAYLGKPVSTTALQVAISNALDKADEQNDSIPEQAQRSFFVKQGNSFKKIAWADVVCLSVSQNYTQVITCNSKNTYLIGSPLQRTLTHVVPKELQKDLIRINRGEAINAAFIEEVTGNTLITRYGSFDVSDTHMRDIKKRLHLIS